MEEQARLHILEGLLASLKGEEPAPPAQGLAPPAPPPEPPPSSPEPDAFELEPIEPPGSRALDLELDAEASDDLAPEGSQPLEFDPGFDPSGELEPEGAAALDLEPEVPDDLEPAGDQDEPVPASQSMESLAAAEALAEVETKRPEPPVAPARQPAAAAGKSAEQLERKLVQMRIQLRNAREQIAEAEIEAQTAVRARVKQDNQLTQLRIQLRQAVSRTAGVQALADAATAGREQLDRQLTQVRIQLREAVGRANQAQDRAEAATAARNKLDRELTQTRIQLRNAQAVGWDRSEELEIKLGKALKEIERLHKHLRSPVGEDPQLEQRAAKVAAQEAKLRQAAGEIQKLKARAAEVDKLAEQLEQTAGRVVELEAALEAGGQAASGQAAPDDTELRQLRLEAETLKRKLAEAEHYQLECTELRQEVQQLNHQIDQIEDLKRMVGILENQLYSAGKVPNMPSTPPVLPVSIPADDSQEGGPSSAVAIQRGMEQLLQISEATAVVVANDQGLLVAAAGDPTYQAELAALGGQAQSLALQAKDFLPLTDVGRLVIQDANALGVTCRMFQVGDEQLTLLALSRGEPPAEDALQQVFSLVASSLGASSPAPAGQPPVDPTPQG